MMAAIPFSDPADVAGLAEVFAESERLRGGNPDRLQKVSNQARVLGHSPGALKAHQALTHFVLGQSSLPGRLREIAVLETGVALHCDYLIHNHLKIARRSGLGEAELEAILKHMEGHFDERETIARSYARQVATSRQIGDRTLADLRRSFSLREISELVLTVSTYHLVAAIVGPMRIEPDA